MNDMNNQGVWLKVKLPCDLNVRLRTEALKHRTTLSAYVVEILTRAPVRGAEPSGSAHLKPTSRTGSATLPTGAIENDKP